MSSFFRRHGSFRWIRKGQKTCVHIFISCIHACDAAPCSICAMVIRYVYIHMWFNMCIHMRFKYVYICIYILYPCSIFFFCSCAIYWRDTAPRCNSATATRYGYNYVLFMHSLLFLSTAVLFLSTAVLFLSTAVWAIRRHPAKPRAITCVCIYIYDVFIH